MKCKRIRIANIGPVTEGEVDMKKVLVFIGPSNAGKSIVSRLIHALRRLDSPPSLLRQRGHDDRKKNRRERPVTAVQRGRSPALRTGAERRRHARAQVLPPDRL